MAQLSGMTGFARTQGAHGDEAWTWEARSVNGKGLDVRLRIPQEFSALEGPIRKAFGDVFSRGNLQLSLNMQAGHVSKKFHINESLIDELESFALDRGGVPELGQLLLVQGVVTEQSKTRTEDEQKSLGAAILQSSKALAAELKQSRGEEGQAVAPLLSSAVEKIRSLSEQASAIADAQPESLKKTLEGKLQVILDSGITEDRLAQEAALLALKADVKEELDRLSAHCDQANELLSKGSPVGRKLGFLSQEFNRETNTLCAKSSDIELTRIGIELKSVVEQFREQAANVE